MGNGLRLPRRRRALLSTYPIVTDVELPSTVPSSQQTGWPRRAALVAGAVVTVLSGVLGVSSRPAVADPLASAQAQAAQITAQLAADQQRLDTTSQQYDAAEQQVQQVGQQISQIKATVAQDESRSRPTPPNLRQEAVSSYMSGTADSDLQTLFSSGGEQATVAGEYQSVASGNISGRHRRPERGPDPSRHPAEPAPVGTDPGPDRPRPSSRRPPEPPRPPSRTSRPPWPR